MSHIFTHITYGHSNICDNKKLAGEDELGFVLCIIPKFKEPFIE